MLVFDTVGTSKIIKNVYMVLNALVICDSSDTVVVILFFGFPFLFSHFVEFLQEWVSEFLI